MFETALLIAQTSGAPELGGYIAVYKPITVIACLFLWLYFCMWATQDIHYVKTREHMWNLIVFGGGLVGFLAWLTLPFYGTLLFFMGMLAWLLLSGGAAITYILHRNTLVAKKARLLTPQHIRSLYLKLTKKGETQVEAVERVRVSDHSGRVVPVPDGDDEREQFVAMQNLIADALWRRASNVDLVVAGDQCKLEYTIDGLPTSCKELLTPIESQQALVLLKRIAGLDVEERRKPQSGKVSVMYPLGTSNRLRIDVESSGSRDGEHMVLKIAADLSKLRLPDLGFAPPRLELFKKVIEVKDGLVICSGPRHSGLTTTLYATIREHDAFISNIHSLERRKSFDLENITQHVHDGQNPDLGFARQLQSVLRREPDVVLVGDCPDHETAELATRAAANGRKIYLSLQAKDCAEALEKYLHLLEDHKQGGKVLRAIVNQRLIRKLCPECREAYKPDAELLRKANLPVDKIEHFFRTPTTVPTDKRGNPIVCQHCQGTGYYGRTGLFELMIFTEEMRTLVRGGAKAADVKAAARKNKMLYLQEEGLIKVIDGLTGMNEVLRALRDGSKR